jgi:hypothetical protein
MSSAIGIIYRDRLDAARCASAPTSVVKAKRSAAPRSHVFKDLWVVVSHAFSPSSAAPTATA